MLHSAESLGTNPSKAAGKVKSNTPNCENNIQFWCNKQVRKELKQLHLGRKTIYCDTSISAATQSVCGALAVVTTSEDHSGYVPPLQRQSAVRPPAPPQQRRSHGTCVSKQNEDGQQRVKSFCFRTGGWLIDDWCMMRHALQRYTYRLVQTSAEVFNKVPKSYRTLFAAADSSQATWRIHSSASRELETKLPGDARCVTFTTNNT